MKAPRVFRLVAASLLSTIAGLVAINVPSWWAQFVAAYAGRRQRWDASDFSAFYSAGKVVARGDGNLLFHPETLAPIQHAHVTLPPGDVLPFLNPPFFAGIMAPLAATPFDRAYQIWSIANLCLLVLVCVQLWRIASPLGTRLRVVALVGFLTLFPLTYALRQGQFSLLLVAGLAGTYLSLRDGRDATAGLWLSLLLLKPELLVPIVLVLALKNRRRVVLSVAALACGAVVASVVIVGLPESIRYPSYVAHVASRGGTGTFTPGMYGWNGLLGATLGAHRAPLELWVHIPLAVGGLILAASMWRADRLGDIAAPWLALVLATLLADPHLYLQDSILVAPAAVAWWAHARPENRATVGWGLLFGWIVLGLGSQPNIAWHVNAFALAMGGTLTILAIGSAKSTRLAAIAPKSTQLEDERQAA